MGAALQGLYDALTPLRLYSLGSGSLVDTELAAYGVALDEIEHTLDELTRQAFVQTSSGAALGRHEQLVGLRTREGMDTADRRDLILYRLGVAPLDNTLDGMVNSIRATGMEADITENAADESIVIRCKGLSDKALDLDALMLSVRTVLPAHLQAEFDIGDLTWDIFEDRDVAWDRWDGTKMTWTDFDINGHNIFTKGEG